MTPQTVLALLVAGLTSTSTAGAPKVGKTKTGPRPSAASNATRTSGQPAARRPKARAARSRGARGKHSTKVRFEIGVQFTRTADDNGGSASTLTRTNAEAAIKRANEIWARRGGDVRFYVHPASNFDTLLRSTTLNQDCDYQPGWSASALAEATNGDLDGDGKVGKAGDLAVICGTTAKVARNAYGAARANRIVVFSRGGNKRVKWDGSAGHWVTYDSNGGAGNPVGFYVRMPRSFGGSTLLAHELGHYLPAGHPFSYQPKTIADARDLMEKYAAKYPGADPAAIFDPDSRRTPAVHDTPPDPSGTLWKAAHGDRCDLAATKLSIDVTVDGRTRTVVLAPDRNLVMSYFKGCNYDHYVSPDQYARVRQSLLHGNRQPLVAAHDRCYAAGWQPGDPVTTEAGLTALMRKIARCTLLAGKRVPWQFDRQDIYVNPSQSAGRQGFSKRGGVGVNAARERALVNAMTRSPMVE